MPAASSAPNATIRMISVIGIERISAFWKSGASLSSNALPDDASPNCSTRSAGCAAATASTAASIGATLSTASSGSPRMSNGCSAERPSCGALRRPGSSATTREACRRCFVDVGGDGVEVRCRRAGRCGVWTRTPPRRGWSASVKRLVEHLRRAAGLADARARSRRASCACQRTLPIEEADATKATQPRIARHGCVPAPAAHPVSEVALALHLNPLLRVRTGDVR